MRDHNDITMRTRWRKSLLAPLAYLLTLVLGVGVAQATNWEKVGEIGSEGQTGNAFRPDGPLGVAIDPSGDAYVSDGGGARVQKFDSTVSANFLLTFGWGVNNEPGKPNICEVSLNCVGGEPGNGPGQFEESFNGMGVAVAPSSPFDVYVVDTRINARVEYFSAGGGYLHQFNGTEIDGAEATHKAPEKLEKPRGIAIDTSGNVYVADTGHNVVDKFTASGEYQCQITGLGEAGSASECSKSAPGPGAFIVGNNTDVGDNLAVDPNGDVYVVDSGNNVVDEFGPEGKYLRRLGAGELKNPQAVAVDSGGHVFVVTNAEGGEAGGKEVYAYEPSGVRSARFGSGEIGGSLGIAVTGSGLAERVYVTDKEQHHVDIYKAALSPACETAAGATEVTATSATVSGTIEPHGINTTYSFEYGFNTNYRGGSTAPGGPVAGTASVPVSVRLTGLEQPNQTYDYQLVITDASGSVECGNQTFKTMAAPPSVDQESAPGNETRSTNALLEAEVNPNNETTTYYAQYSPGRTGGSLNNPAISEPAQLSSGFGDQSASATIVGLTPNTTYYYRFSASNTLGQTSEGPIQTLLTAPATPVTSVASGITQTAAMIAGSLNPGGHATRDYFQYRAAACIAASCWSQTPTVEAGPGTSVVEVDTPLNGLQPLTTYDYRLVAVNATGPSFGPEREFTTLLPAFTGPPLSIGSTMATVAGEVFALGVPTTYRVEYGTDTTYGGSMPAPEGDGGSSTTGNYVTVTLNGLQPATTYHYRLVTTNSFGEGEGADGTFTTNASGEPSSGPPPAGFSLTGTAPAGPAAVTFASLAAFAPTPPASSGTKGSTSAASTPRQRLSNAVKACRKEKSKAKRAKCEKQARAKYGSKAKKR